ncbi:putative protein N(5)-glutamine methyltransferase [Streptomyces sp. 4N509B]|uniref:putative protein N(5)-glutamine methyltransferase n=1 Tax=Streptomyces sp. 4N509B TaxID=3457413 RepID=UPI003FD45A44
MTPWTVVTPATPVTPSTPSAPAPVTTDLVARLRTAGCVFAEEEADLITATARTPEERASMVHRRVAGHPLEHVLGWAAFCGLRIHVTPGVFVPRRRTEFLVERAAALAPPGAVVVDLCCGTGALGAALAHRADVAALHATDLSPAAVACARKNLSSLGPRAHTHQGDLFGPLPAALRGRVDVLLANVPYVPTAEIPLLPPEARLHEPPTALDGGPDGLSLLRRVVAEALSWLAPGGALLSEISEPQAPAATHALATAGLTPHLAQSPDHDATVLIGGKPPRHQRQGNQDR